MVRDCGDPTAERLREDGGFEGIYTYYPQDRRRKVSLVLWAQEAEPAGASAAYSKFLQWGHLGEGGI